MYVCMYVCMYMSVSMCVYVAKKPGNVPSQLLPIR